MRSSITAPKMMLQSSWAAFWMMVEASLTSVSLRRGGAGDVDEDAACAVDGAGFEQRGGHGGDGGFLGAVGAGADGGSHDGVAHAGHGGLYVGEVAVDDAGDGDDVGDALNALAEDVVGDAEALEEAGVLGDGEELFVGDDDEGVDGLEQLLHAAFGLHHAALAFEGEGAGDDRDGERAHLAGERGDDRGGAGAGASAEAGGDEDHVGAFEGFDDLVGVFEGGAAADVGVGAGAQAAGELDAELELDGGVRDLERLHVGVSGDELHAFDPGCDHAIDGVVAAAAYADDLDASALRAVVLVLNPKCVIRRVEHVVCAPFVLKSGGGGWCAFAGCESVFRRAVADRKWGSLLLNCGIAFAGEKRGGVWRNQSGYHFVTECGLDEWGLRRRGRGRHMPKNWFWLRRVRP